MRTLIFCTIFMLTVLGCAQMKELGRGAADGGMREARDAMHERLANDPRVPDELRAVLPVLVDSVVDGVASQMPKPADPVQNGAWYTLGGFLAMFAASFAKGYAKKKGWMGSGA